MLLAELLPISLADVQLMFIVPMTKGPGDDIIIVCCKGDTINATAC